MKKIPNRCGQCGRTFTKAQWRRNDFWCPSCQKYECYECIGNASICPACGTGVTRSVSKIAFVGIIVGLITLPMILLTAWANPPVEQNHWIIYGFMVSLPLILFLIGLASVFISQKQKKQHLEHLSRMPSGVIPIENRPGYNNPNIRIYWKKENLKRTARNAPAHKGTYPLDAFDGLLGNWDNPVLSKEEMIEHTAKSEKKMIRFSAKFILGGITGLSIGFYFGVELLCLIPGIMFLLLSGIMIVASYSNKKWAEQDNYRETSVMWKQVGFQTTILAIQEFLQFNKIAYQRVMVSQSKNDFRYPEFKYVLANGNYIQTYYSEWSGGHVYRSLKIGYTPSNYIQAKKLQRDMDEFLVKRDLIRRVG